MHLYGGFATTSPCLPIVLVLLLNFNTFNTTRGNTYLQKFMCHFNIRKYSFCARVVNIWNSLPNEVVEADTVNAFKYRLDKHWSNQDVLFDFNADLTATGSVPICIMQNAGKEDYLRPSEHTGLDLIGWDCFYSLNLNLNSRGNRQGQNFPQEAPPGESR